MKETRRTFWTCCKAAQKIQQYVQGKNLEYFKKDELLQDAVERNITLNLGEERSKKDRLMHPEAERFGEIKSFLVDLVRRGGGAVVSLDAIRAALQAHPLIPLCYRSEEPGLLLFERQAKEKNFIKLVDEYLVELVRDGRLVYEPSKKGYRSA
jgi:hypothetical protein